LKRDALGETTPEEKSFFSEYQGSASSLWRKALPVSSAPIHQKLGRASILWLGFFHHPHQVPSLVGEQPLMSSSIPFKLDSKRAGEDVGWC